MSIFKILSIFQHKRIKQIGTLYSSMILGIVIGIVVSVLNTRFLGPEIYGDFKYIQSVYSLFAILITFGFFFSSGRLLADKKNELIRKELIGSSLIITSILGILFSLVLLLFSIVQKNYFTSDLSFIFVVLAPFFFFIPFSQSFENILQGENRIYELAILRQLPQVLYIAIISLLYIFGVLNILTALISQLSTLGIVVVLLIIHLKPRFNNFKKYFNIIFSENKKYGFQVYLGTIIGVASTQFGPIAISYFSNSNIDVGFYSLAYTTTMPLVMIPSVVGTAMFKEFANRTSIPRKATILTILFSFLALVGFLIIIKPLILYLYTEKYSKAIDLAYIVAVGQIFHGFGNYYNRFLGAHGQGKKLRNGALYVGVANFTGFILLVPIYGAVGAAATKLFSGVVYAFVLYVYYRLYLRSSNTNMDS